MKTRRCSTCREVKPLSEYNRMRRDALGRQRDCRACQHKRYARKRKPQVIKDKSGEEWRDVLGYKGLYQVSNLGRVKSLERFDSLGRCWPVKLLTPFSERGYLFVGLHKDGKRRKRPVHALVAAAFIGPRPRGYTVNHKNGDKQDNRPRNLEYLTNSDNAKHSIEVLGNSVRGTANGAAVLNEEDVIEIRELYASGKYSYSQLAKERGVARSTIAAVISRQNWAWLD